MKPIVLGICLTAGLAALPLQAATAAQLYSMEPSTPLFLETATETPTATESSPVVIRLDPEVLAANPDLLRLPLPDGREIEARRKRFVTYNSDWVSWTADLFVPATEDRAAERGVAHLIYLGNRVVGIVNLDSTRFRITHQPALGHRLVQAESLAGGSCGMDLTGISAAERLSGRTRPAPGHLSEAILTTQTEIDLVVLYTDDFLSSPLAQAQVEDFILTSVSIANDVFVDSQIDATYNLAYMGPVTGPGPTATTILSGRTWMSLEPAELQLLRDTYGGDMVALIVPESWAPTDTCGVATLPLANDCDCGSGTQFTQRAFSVHRIDCGLNDYTFAHELGHNFGMWHDEPNPTNPRYRPEDLLFPFAFGHTFDVAAASGIKEEATDMRASVLGCVPEDIGGPVVICNRVGLFSDPSLTFNGVPVGTASRWNAEVARQQKLAYSLFRTPPTNGVPMVEILSPARDIMVSSGVPITFSGTASDPEDQDISSLIDWRSDIDGPLGTGAQITASLSRGNHYVTARVVDSSGQAAEWSTPLIADAPPVASFVYSCLELACDFDGRETSDDGPIHPFSIEWTFGDGSTGGFGYETQYTYATPGIYTVSLSVTDSAGQNDTVMQTITVTGPPPPPSCSPSSTVLCLQGNRFEVEVSFVNGGPPQAATTHPYSDQSGFFSFFNPSNLEVAVKVLDGTSINGSWWVFHGAMTSLEYTITVTDTVAGTIKTYNRPATTGSVQCGGGDTGAFAALATGPEFDDRSHGLLGQDSRNATEAGTCTPASDRICLLGSRFRVQVIHGGGTKSGIALTNNSGTFWFGQSSNSEVPIKILDGTSVNGKYWVFFGSQTNQSYQVIVTDTVTSAVKTYNAPSPHCGIADTAAF